MKGGVLIMTKERRVETKNLTDEVLQLKSSDLEKENKIDSIIKFINFHNECFSEHENLQIKKDFIESKSQ